MEYDIAVVGSGPAGYSAALNCVVGKKKARLDIMPRCIFTMPSLGAVGMTEQQASKAHVLTKGKFPFAASGKALAFGTTEGFVKWIADKKIGRQASRLHDNQW